MSKWDDLSKQFDSLENKQSNNTDRWSQLSSDFDNSEKKPSSDRTGQLRTKKADRQSTFQQPQKLPYDPTGSFLENLSAGVGKGMVDLYRGAKQRFNIGDQQKLQAEIDEAKRLDKPLMNTWGGILGNLAGNVGTTAPAMLVPGANTVVGGAGIGGALGALSPTGKGENPYYNAMLGAGFGGAFPALGNIAKGARAVVIDPFTEAGADRTIQSFLKNYVKNPQEAIKNLRQNTGQTPGFNPTVGQASVNREAGDTSGLAALERAFKAADTQGFADIEKNQMASLVNALKSVAKTPEERQIALENAKNLSKDAYTKAFKEYVPVTDELRSIVNTPSVKSAEQRAIQLAAEKRIPFETRISDMSTKSIPIQKNAEFNKVIEYPENAPNIYAPHQDQAPKEIWLTGDKPLTSYVDIPPVDKVPVKDVHLLKMGMDAMLSDPKTGIAKLEADAIKKTRGDLLDQLPKAYQDARNSHIQNMRPVNEMDIGTELYKKFVPALADSTDIPFASRAATFADDLRNGDQLAKNVTGLKNAKMNDVMSPEAMQLLEGVKNDAALKAAAENAGKGTGSNTYQNFSMGNILSNVGIPKFAMNVPPLSWVNKIGDVVYKDRDANLKARMAELFKSPEDFAKALEMANAKDSPLTSILKKYSQSTATSLPKVDADYTNLPFPWVTNGEY